MATSTNSKVFVSPGVYTSEVDLSYVAQSVGVTTLGMVGETLKGPAFEPIFKYTKLILKVISSFNNNGNGCLDNITNILVTNCSLASDVNLCFSK